MIRKYNLVIVLFLLVYVNGFSQDKVAIEKERIQKLAQTLDSLQIAVIGLTKTVDFNVSNIELPSFIRAVGKARKVNLGITPELENISLTHNFSNATIKDVLVYLCKEHKLTFDITGNIISLKKYIPEKEKKKAYASREIPVSYNVAGDLFSIDLQNDTLSVAFKKITNATGKNLVYSPELSNRRVSGFIKDKSFESAIDKLAFANDLLVTKTKDNYYLFESNGATQFSTRQGNSQPPQNPQNNQNKAQRPARYRKTNFFFKVIDYPEQKLEVDFENTPIGSIIKDIAYELKINMFTNAPIDNIGTASVKATDITYDELLTRILEDTKFTFKNKNGIYYFGEEKQASLRSSVVIPLMHRSIEVMNQPIQSKRNSNSNFNSNLQSGGVYNNSQNQNQNQNQYQNQNFNNNNNSVGNFNNRQNVNTQNNQSFGNYSTKSEALVNILPKEVVQGLEIKTDVEQNTFIVSGDAQKIEKFKEFISKIDKAVPVVLIEVMILEVSKSATVSTGVDMGIGDAPVSDNGNLFSATDLTLGSKTINKIIGGFSGFGSLNIGKVVPNFFARIQLMETNGDIKIRSTPKLSTLNGHQAMLSNGERSYYKVTRTDIIGSQTTQTIQTNNYVPIDADLSIGIRPMVSGDEQITLNINVSQSSFNGKRVDSEAPPGMNSREFTSTIRVADQDVIILGGLEENIKNDSGTGVPFLARIPILKWLFSKKSRTDSKTKLSVLIKPTIIR